MMERTQILDLMGELKLYGMRSAYDDVMATGIKRQHEPPQIVGDLLNAEIAEKHARSIKYQMTLAKLPLAKDLDDFDFDNTAVNETLVRDLAGGGFYDAAAQHRSGGRNRHRKNASCHRHRPKLHSLWSVWSLFQHRRSRQSAGGGNPRRAPRTHRRLSHQEGLRRVRRTRLSTLRPSRRAAALPSRQPALRAHFGHRHHQSKFWRMAKRFRRRQNDHRVARSSHSPLRHRRDRQRKLAVQKSRLSLKACLTPPRSPRLRSAKGSAGVSAAVSVRLEKGPCSTPIRGPN